MKEIVNDLMHAVLGTSVVVSFFLALIFFGELLDCQDPSETLAIAIGVSIIPLIFSTAYLARSSLREENKD
jgi:hypothetical protein